jgi:hypothetical protein
MIGTFREDRPWLLLTVPLWSLLPWIGLAFGVPYPQHTGGGLVGEMLRWASERTAWAPMLLGTMLTTIITLQLVTLVNDSELAMRRGMLPVIVFPLLVALDGVRHLPGPELLALPIVLLAIRRSWLSSSDRHGLRGLFDTGLLVGAASLLYAPYLLLLIVVWATTAVFRPFGWRDHLAPLLAVAVVRWLEWGTARVTGHAIATPLPRTGATAMSSLPGSPVFTILFWTVVVLLLVMALIGFVQGYQRSVMHGKNLRSALLALALCTALLAGFAQVSGTGSPTVLFAAPASILLCAPFSDTRRQWLMTGIWAGLFVLALWTQWGAGLSSPA